MEKPFFSELDEDFKLIVESVLNKYLKNNYSESEKDQLFHKLEIIIQKQVKLIYRSKISDQVQSKAYFPYFPINPTY